ncbi:MAG: DUF1566 domain-containing protein [Deltaproteobacteria bacterium]|nr:DUF1566 domain-containing protein [Deltaproteobacteria bacterium]
MKHAKCIACLISAVIVVLFASGCTDEAASDTGNVNDVGAPQEDSGAAGDDGGKGDTGHDKDADEELDAGEQQDAGPGYPDIGDSGTGVPDSGTGAVPYPIVDTAQAFCYGTTTAIACPSQGAAFYGQDGQFLGNQPGYTRNADGLTVHDNVTGLTWMQSPDTDRDGTITYADKLTWTEAQAVPAALNAATYGGYSDWRLPSIKELYSLINFSGTDTPPDASTGTTPFIDTDYFGFSYGFIGEGERIIDSQWVTSTKYVATTMGGNETMFGVNFADGRIKGYPTSDSIGKKYHVLCVRGNISYGANNFADNGDGTVTDEATGLMWAQSDSGTGMNWQSALAWVQTKNAESYLGHNDWRLPNAKELQSIVDYTRSPNTTGSAAIDPVFTSTQIINEAGEVDYPFYWTSTTHASSNGSGGSGVYVAFGRALGYMNGTWLDVHGAGAQRSDPKEGAPNPYGHGPQGDVVRVLNHVRLVRNGAIPGELDGGSWPDASILPQDGGQPPADGGMPPMDGGIGPKSCNAQSDCDAPGACPPDAVKGCTCTLNPQGQKLCIPACSTDADCPKPPDVTLTCGRDGLCVPA